MESAPGLKRLSSEKGSISFRDLSPGYSAGRKIRGLSKGRGEPSNKESNGILMPNQQSSGVGITAVLVKCVHRLFAR